MEHFCPEVYKIILDFLLESTEVHKIIIDLSEVSKIIIDLCNVFHMSMNVPLYRYFTEQQGFLSRTFSKWFGF